LYILYIVDVKIRTKIHKKIKGTKKTKRYENITIFYVIKLLVVTIHCRKTSFEDTVHWKIMDRQKSGAHKKK
jgi:hypothetical protein